MMARKDSAEQAFPRNACRPIDFTPVDALSLTELTGIAQQELPRCRPTGLVCRQDGVLQRLLKIQGEFLHWL